MKVDVYTIDGSIREANQDDHTYKTLAYLAYDIESDRFVQRFARFDSDEARKACIALWHREQKLLQPKMSAIP